MTTFNRNALIPFYSVSHVKVMELKGALCKNCFYISWFLDLLSIGMAKKLHIAALTVFEARGPPLVVVESITPHSEHACTCPPDFHLNWLSV